MSSEGEAAAAAALCGALGALLEQLEGGDEAARVWESNAEARFREVAGASAGSESGSGSAGAPAGEGGVRAAAAAREARIYREGCDGRCRRRWGRRGRGVRRSGAGRTRP